MSYVNLKMARVACVALSIVIAIVGLGNNGGWWRINPSLASAWWLGVLGLAALFVGIGEILPGALARDRAEFARRKEQERQRQSAAAVERYERQKVARDKALAIARGDYPNHVDFGALGERGWWGDYDNVDMVAAYLDPPEVVLKYEIPGGNDDDEIRLYARERVEAAEANAREVKDHIRSVLSQRESAAEAQRAEEEQARLDAEAAAAEAQEEEEEKRELQRRLAQQKIIRIDDRLK